MTETECRSSSDGSAISLTRDGSQRCTCAESKPAPSSHILAHRHRPHEDTSLPDHHALWKTTSSGLLFVIACLTNPCCTPLLVPFGLTLLAGTPLALWTTQYLGWIYGMLTVICVCSLVFAFRSLGQRPSRSS